MSVRLTPPRDTPRFTIEEIRQAVDMAIEKIATSYVVTLRGG